MGKCNGEIVRRAVTQGALSLNLYFHVNKRKKNVYTHLRDELQPPGTSWNHLKTDVNRKELTQNTRNS